MKHPGYRPRTGALAAAWAYIGTGVFALLVSKELVRVGTFQRQLKTILLGGALVVSAAVVVNPILAFPAILVAAPFEFPMKLAGRQAGSNEVLAIGLALVLAPRLRRREIPGWALAGYGCLVLGSCVSIFGASAKSQALWGSVRWLAVGIVALAALQLLSTRPDASRRAVDIISATGAIVAVFALLQRSGTYWIVGPPYLAGRVDSSFGYYTVFAGYMMVASLVAVGAAIDAYRRSQPGRFALHAGGALLSGVGLGISLSRGALFGAACGVLAMVVLNVRSPRRATTALLALTVSVGLVWFATPSSTRTQFAERLAQPAASAGSDQEHAALARIGERALRSHPFGLGYGNFASYMAMTESVAGKTFFHSHRLPVQIGLDAGWLGLLGFGLAALAPLAAAASAARRARLTPTGAAFAAALVAFLAQGWFDYLFYELSFLVVFAALSWGTWHAVKSEARA
jgi:O-Antigen ligase